jgi:hypothetical protein
MKKIDITKQDKIILVLSEISNLTKKNIKFEDIVVRLFKKFPKDFHLRGYDIYPDSGDAVKRALYTLRDRGFLYVNNMVFSLSEKGIDSGKKMLSHTKGSKIVQIDNLDRYILSEINRIKRLESFNMFLKGELENISMTDLFDYLGVSVRTNRMDFQAKLKSISEVVSKFGKKDWIYKFHNFITKKFKQDIDYKLSN